MKVSGAPKMHPRSGHRVLRWLAQVALLSLPCLAQANVDIETETYGRDWNGIRSAWSEKGFSAELLFKGTLMTNPEGGGKRGAAYMQNLELKVGLDADTLLGISDSSGFLHVLFNNGGKMNRNYVDSLMGVDNSEANDNTPKLFQAWVNKNFIDSTVSVLAGIYPLDSEFYVTDSSGIFLHPSLGMAAEVAQTGANGPSIYPLAALGMRIKYQPTSVLYAQAAVVDANPGEGRNPHWTRVNPLHGDGSLVMAEIGYHPIESHHETGHSEGEKHAILTEVEKLEQRYEGIGKYAIGYWAYSKDFEDLLDNDANGNPLRRGNRGIYVLMENTLYRSKDSASEVAAFLRHGRAEKDVNIFDASTSVGVRVRGLISGRVDNFFGLAITRSDVSEKFRLAQEAAGTAVPDHEAAVELTYRAQIEPWLVIQPTVQRIFNPGLTPDVKNATVIGVRCEISL